MMFGCARRCGGDAHSVFRMAAFLLMMTNVSRLDLHDEATPSFPGRQTGRRRVDLAGIPKARIRAAVRRPIPFCASGTQRECKLEGAVQTGVRGGGGPRGPVTP